MVLDDICRDVYENHFREQRIKNINAPMNEEPPTYDRYLKERKALSFNHEAALAPADREPNYESYSPTTNTYRPDWFQ